MPSVTPPEMPGVGSAAKIGLESNGRTIALTVGRRLTVTLASNWTPPQASATGAGGTAELQPLRLVSSTGYPAREVAMATFLGVRTGVATVTAQSDYACLHTTPRCALPQQTFTVTVRVLPPTSTGGGPLPEPVS